MKTIVYCGGTWGPNIGNAFFNLGIIYALKKALPNYDITFLGDPPGWTWAYGRNPNNKPNVLIDDLKCDYIIISGPLFCNLLEPIWGNTLRKLSTRGTKIVFLSAGCIDYTDEEYKSCLLLLKDIEPYIMITRDSQTYERYAKHIHFSHDGICFAFFASDYIKENLVLETNDLAICFDKGNDYNVLEQYPDEILEILKNGGSFSNGAKKKLRRKFKASQIKDFYGWRVIRPYHVSNTRMRTKIKSLLLNYKVFRKPNSYVADIPEGYLHIYKNSKLTISERVHACVPAIAFGNYAWLISKSKRVNLFSRIGIPEILEHPVKGDMQLIEDEKKKMLTVIKEHF